MSQEIPYKIYLSEEEMPTAVVQSPRRYEKQARAAAESRQPASPWAATDLRAGLLRRACPSGAGQRHAAISKFPEEIREFLQDVPSVAARARVLPREKARTRRRRSTINSRATTPPAATSSTPPSRRRITPRSRALRGVTTETGAGQWGTALSMACAYSGPGLQGLHGQVLL